VVASRFVGLSVDAVIGRADDGTVAGFRERVQITELELDPLSLEEIFVALCGDENGGV